MPIRDTLRRVDWLAQMQALLIAGLICMVGFMLVVGLGTAVTDDGVSVDLPAAAVSGVAGPAHGLNHAATIAPLSTVQVEIADPTVHQRVAEVLTGLPTALLIVAMLAMLLRIVRQARRGDPFTAGIGRQLRRLAAVVLAGGALASVVEAVAAADLITTLGSGTIGVTWNAPVAWLLAGVGFLAIAEVVNRGTALRAELDTVV